MPDGLHLTLNHYDVESGTEVSRLFLEFPRFHKKFHSRQIATANAA